MQSSLEFWHPCVKCKFTIQMTLRYVEIWDIFQSSSNIICEECQTTQPQLHIDNPHPIG